jgi:hypothetical protein
MNLNNDTPEALPLARVWLVHWLGISPTVRRYQEPVGLERVLNEHIAAVAAEPVLEIELDASPPLRRNAVPLTAADRIEHIADRLMARAHDADMLVTGDGRVTCPTAAALLELTPGHMKNLRSQGAGPVYHRAGFNGHRVSYHVRDLAIWVESRREDW